MIKVLRNAIPQEICKFISHNMDLHFNLIDYPKDNTSLCSNAVGDYAPIFLDSLLVYLQPLIEKTVAKKLHPTFSFGRIYYNGSNLTRHVDQEGRNEYGVSCCIQKDVDWSLYFEKSGKSVSYNLNVGDIITYKGMEYYHWREPYQGNEFRQVFLNYVDVDGQYADWKYDKRECLGQVKHTNILNLSKTIAGLIQ
tara:strand:- start:56 stop:640 length:585 start_codon:yes stop_codon:yes gene_type:complete